MRSVSIIPVDVSYHHLLLLTLTLVEDDEEDTPMLGGSEDPNPTLLDSSSVGGIN